MSMSPEYQKDSPNNYRYKSRSGSRSPHHRRHKKNYHSDKERMRNGDYENDGDSDYCNRGSRDKDQYWDEDVKKSRSRSPNNEHGRDRRHHRRREDRDHHRSRRRGRSASRWEKKSEERKMRERERSYRDDDGDSDSDRSGNGAVLGASGSEIIGYKSQPPNKTIMIRGLAQHITENDIRQDIIQCGLMPRDIRLIRKKDTGASRGFAFVEFGTLGEAMRWMDMKQGGLMLFDQFRAIMQYSILKENSTAENPQVHKASADWFCIKCGGQNFKRRDNCFKCRASRMESEEGGSGSDEICSYATKTIMMRNLDALTTEDSVMNVLNSVIPELVKSISAVCIGRDPLTSTSRGICYLGTESTIDALAIHGALSALQQPLTIDGKTVILSYCKYNMGDTKKAYSQADNAAFPNAAVPSTYAMTDVDSLAEYAARRYAKTPQEYMSYIEYYRSYFSQQISAGHTITLHQENQMDAANAAAAVAQSAIQQMNANKSFFDSTHMAIPSGTDGKRYPIPDVSKYTYDKATGYQFDPTTGLYYDPNSNYYWNCVIQKYLYWDQDKMTYVLAPSTYDNFTGTQATTQPTTSNEMITESENKRNNKVEKQDKVKVAKKIAKDMERWAKTLNQKKELSVTRNYVDQSASSSSASADIGFAVLEKKSAGNMVGSQLHGHGLIEDMAMNNDVAATSPPSTSLIHNQASAVAPTSTAPLVAAYGGESESSSDEDEEDFLDYQKLICHLCKRQLGSAEALNKHAKLSSLHKQNLESRRNAKKVDNENNARERIVYRDRAKERRMKYGANMDEPQPSELKEKYLKARETDVTMASGSGTSAQEPIGAENVGNRLLQKMGWSEGQGLGKQNQGRTSIVQAVHHSSGVGLGNKAYGYTRVAGESYKDCVKKMMYIRYQELTEKENNS